MLLDDEEDSILNVIAFKIGQIVNGKNKKVMEYGITILEAILDTESLLVRKKVNSKYPLIISVWNVWLIFASR